jgi:hypothetical protein
VNLVIGWIAVTVVLVRILLRKSHCRRMVNTTQTYQAVKISH